MYIDDVSLTKVITEPEASSPLPEDGQNNVSTQNISLEWLSGFGAIKHNVYFGEAADNLQLVADGITENIYQLPELDHEKEYFWRIDEVDAVDLVTPGTVWSFTTGTFYEEYMSRVKTQRIESEEIVDWKQFGPGNAGFVNFLRYHPLLPDFCLTSPDLFDTYQTEDNGTSWKTVKDVDGTGQLSRLYDMFYSRKTASFAIAIESSRLFISQDTARSWQLVHSCPWYDTHGGVTDDSRSWFRKISAVALDPSDDNTWYVGAGNFCRGQQQLWSTLRDVSAANPRGNDSPYMGTIWKTTNAGQSWTSLSNGLHPQAQFSRIIVHPENSNLIFAGSQYGLFRSMDGGENWTNIGEGKLDNNTIMNMDFYYDAATSKFILYVADQVRYYPDGQTTRSDGGIFRSEDNGDNWTNINGNLGLDINRLTGGVPDNYYKYIAKWFGITEADAKATYPNTTHTGITIF